MAGLDASRHGGKSDAQGGSTGDEAGSPVDDAAMSQKGQLRSHRPSQGQRRGSHQKDRGRGDRDGDNIDDGDDGYSSVSSGEGESSLIRADGHTYHGSGDILVPNDESERARLEIQHALFRLCLEDKLTFTNLPEPASLDHPMTILDIGAGTGIWAVEMGELYPTARIRGIDVSSMLLPTAVPPNVTFEIADANEPWGASNNGKGTATNLDLDFVHVRNLVGGGVRDWKRLFEQAYEHLRPGGQIEVSEVRPRWFTFDDAELEAKQLSLTACRELEANFALMSIKLGVDFDPIAGVRKLLEDVGFERAVEMTDLVPFQPSGTDDKMRRKAAQMAQLIEYGTPGLPPWFPVHPPFLMPPPRKTRSFRPRPD